MICAVSSTTQQIFQAITNCSNCTWNVKGLAWGTEVIPVQSLNEEVMRTVNRVQIDTSGPCGYCLEWRQKYRDFPGPMRNPGGHPDPGPSGLTLLGPVVATQKLESGQGWPSAYFRMLCCFPFLTPSFRPSFILRYRKLIKTVLVCREFVFLTNLKMLMRITSNSSSKRRKPF